MRLVICLIVPLLTSTWLAACAPAPVEDPAVLERGRYLVQLAGCNDCHTEGYIENGGKVPEQEWLKGNRRGWHNAEGTTYAANLRLLLSQIDEEQWVKLARTMRAKAPMVWYRLREMKEPDLRAIYRYVRWLGPAGNPAPPPLPAGVTPPEPFINFPAVH